MLFNFPHNGQKAELDALSRSQAVIHFTPDGTILDANDNFLKAMGYTLDEIKGKHHRMFVDPAYAQSHEYREFWDRLGKGVFEARQFRRLGKGGREIWIEASYNPVLDKAGKVVRVVKYATDITQTKLKNADYEGQLNAIGRAQAFIQFALDGTILDANENFLNAMGYALDEIKGKHHRMFVDAAYAQSQEYREFWDKLNRGQFFSSEFRRFGKGGKEIWIQASYNPIMDMNGKPFKVVKYATDITAQKRAAADFKGQIDAINRSQAVIEFDLDGTILEANGTFLGALGYTLDEIKGKHHRMFVDAAYAQSQEYREFWEKLRRGEYDSRVYKRITKSGREIWILASYNPIFDMNGRPFKVVKFATDLTDVVETGEIARETASNVQSVAAAVEEMVNSIEEINRNMTMSRQAVDTISRDSLDSSAAADQLMSSVKSMENIIQLINDIAGQVNLLALNATIEAARAGESGKGFAVVANEVKSLATQTSKATDDIATQIQGVSDMVLKVVGSVKNISSSAENVNQYVGSVASAITQQSAVTREISANTQNTAVSMENIADRIKKLSAVA